MKSLISQSKTSVECLINRLDQAEGKISEFKDEEHELEHSDKDKDKNKKVQMKMQDSWVTIKRIHLNHGCRRRGTAKGIENIFNKTVEENPQVVRKR
jgi:hypothetical protein